MKKIIFSFLFLAIICSASFASATPVINSVTMNNPDNFFSNFSGNNIINIIANVSGMSQFGFVSANFSLFNGLANIDCKGPGTSVINLSNQTYGGSIFNGTCDVGDEAAVSNFNVIAPIIISVIDMGPPIMDFNLSAVLYNMTTPPQMPSFCQRFGNLTTNFATVLDFSRVNFIIQVEQNGSCLTGPGGGTSPWNGFQPVMMMNFTSLNMSNQSIGQKLALLKDALQVSIAAPHVHNATRVYLNETAFRELDTNATITLNNIPFYYLPTITSNNLSRISNLNPSFILNSPFNITITSINKNILVPNGNLTFNVAGFTEYNSSDTIPPIITIKSPLTNMNSSGPVVVSVIVNGTITDPSYILINLNSSLSIYYNASGTSSINCTGNGTDTLNCTTLVNLSLGQYMLNVTAWDYGGSYPGNRANNFSLFNISSGSVPSVSIISPLNNGYYSNRTRLVNLSLSNFASAWFSNGTANISYNPSGTNYANFAEGINVLTAYANDSNGQISSSTITFTIDSTPPLMSLLNPAINAIYNNASVPFTFSVIGNSNLLDCNLYLDGNLNTDIIDFITNTTNTTIVNGISNGLHNWSLECYENDGNPTNDTLGPANNISETRFFIVDTTPPNITLISPSNGTITPIGIVNFTANISTDYTNISNATLLVYNQTGLFSSTTVAIGAPQKIIGIIVPLTADGAYTWLVNAIDLAGNSASSISKKITIDTTKPIPTITSLSNGQTIASLNIPVSAIITELNLNFSGISLLNSSGSTLSYVTNTSSSFSITLTAPSDGNYTVNVTSYDLAGNFNSTAKSIVIDTKPPTYSGIIASPASPVSYVKNSVYLFNISWTDPSIVSAAVFNFNGVNYSSSLGNSQYSFSLTDLGVGTYAYYFWANDSLGNANLTSVYNYSVNQSVPVLNLTLNGTQGNINIPVGSMISINGAIVLGDNSNLMLYKNGALINSGNSPVNNLTSFNSMGSFNITLVCTSSQNYSQSSQTFYVNVSDTTPPTATLISPSNGNITNTGNINFTASVSDNSNVSNATLFIYNQTGLYSSTSIAIGAPQMTIGIVVPLADGTYTWFVRATDSSGNSAASTNSTILVDTKKPAPIIISPANNQLLGSLNVPVNVSIIESNLSSSIISLLNLSGSTVSSVTNANSNFNITLTAPSDGNYTVNVTSYDLAGNFNSTAKSISIDSTPPVITVLSPASGSTYYANQSIALSASMYDMTPNVLWYNFNGTNITSGTSVSTSISYPTNQTATIQIFANDSFNRITSTLITITIASSIPENSTLITNQTTLAVNDTINNIIFSYNASLQNITVNSTFFSKAISLDLSQVLVNQTVTLGSTPFNLERQGTTYNYSAYIPSGTVITGSGWDGKISLPIVTSASSYSAPSGSADLVVNLGSGVELDFSVPVKVVIGGMAGRKAAWNSGGTGLIDITNYCSNATNPSLSSSIKEIYPNKEFRKLVEYSNEARKNKRIKFYEHREQRKINWIAYNNSQINNIKESLDFIRKEVDRCNNPPRKVGKPIDGKLYSKAVLTCELFGLTERNAQGFFELFGSSLGIFEKMDDRTIGNAYEKIEVAFILKQIFERNKDSNGDLMGDGTGLETSRRQNYGDNNSSTKEFMTSIVDTREIVQAFDFSKTDEQTAMFDLVEEVDGEKLKLDAGFNNRELVRKIAEYGMLPYVYPYKINDINGSEAWREMYLDFFTDVIAWLTEYYQRVHCESFHSAFKRVFGIIRKTRPHSKFIQVTARIILHNRARLSYFKRIKK